jgi:hypothetical protein
LATIGSDPRSLEIGIFPLVVRKARRRRSAQGGQERNGADDASIEHDLLPFAVCVLERSYFG